MGMSKTEQQEDNVVLGESYPAEDITSPDHTDVLLGRGAGVNKHPGNKYFRDIVKQYQDDYLVAKNNYEKYLTSMEILKSIRNLNPPGRFVLQDSSSRLWNDVGDDRARRKISQALRENATELRKSFESDDSEKSNTACNDDVKLTRNNDKQDDLIDSHEEPRNVLDSAPQTTSERSVGLSVSDLEVLLQDVKRKTIDFNEGSSYLDSSPQTISERSTELSMLDLEVLLQDFKPGAMKKTQAMDCNSNMLEIESIGTFAVDHMSL